MTDKLSAALAQDAEQCYKKAQRHIGAAEMRGDPLRAIAAQMMFNFSRVLIGLSGIAKQQEESAEKLAHLERMGARAGHADMRENT